jgi:C4-dicarboxylate transporter DctM subunit
MKRFNYADELSAGSVASGGGLGMIMPPSVVLIIYGIFTEQSIGKLFVAGILPAILVTFFSSSPSPSGALSPRQGPVVKNSPWKERTSVTAGHG